MATLTIGDRKVTVDDAFLSLSPEAQNATVEEIASSLGMGGGSQSAPEPATTPEPAPAAPKAMEDVPDILDPSHKLYGQRHGGSIVTGIIDGLTRAVNTPREVYEGKIDLNTPEGQDRAIETALVGVTAPPTGLMKLAPAAAVEAAPKAGPNAVIEASKSLNIPVPMGIATESRAIQAATQAARQAPIGGGIIEKAADNFLGGVRTAVDDTAAMVNGGNAANRATAGGTIRKAAEGAIERNKAEQAEPFKVLRGAIDADRAVPVTGDLAGTLNNVMRSRVAAGEGALPKDLAPLTELATNPNGATFNGLQRARTTLAERIDFEEAQGFSVADLKQAYGAVTQAMESAVQQSAIKDPQAALSRFKFADKEFGRRAETNKSIRQVLRAQSDEALADKVIGMASQGGRANIQQIRLLQRELGDDAFKELSSVTIGQMGVGRSGEFSFATLVSNWNKLSPEGKAYLFRDQGVRKRMDDIMTLAGRAKEVEAKFANKSNTGRAGLAGGMLAGAMIEPMTAIGSAIGGAAFGKLVSTPATSAMFTRWARLAEVAKRSPSAANNAALQAASTRLADAAHEAGINLPVVAILQAMNDNGQARTAIGQ